MEKELATVEEVCHKVQRLGRLESEMQLDDERVRDLHHDITLNLRILHLVVLDDEVLFQRLHCENPAIIFFLGHVNLSERSPPNDL